MKRVLTIQDISCIGKCSTTIALPIISAMGVETVILPSAILSAHTIFEGFTFKDLTAQFAPICHHWKQQGIHFDAIYTGYLGTIEQMALVRQIFEDFKDEDTLIFIDPVMADHGKLYPTFDESYAAENAKFCGAGDIIVPNITEACLMTQTPYQEEVDEAFVRELLQKLMTLGVKTAVLTGIGLEEGKNGIYGYDSARDEYFSYQNDNVGTSFHGTGDLFASVSVGGILRGLPYREAFALAADYTVDTIRATMANPERRWYGVDFENTIIKLVNSLDERLKKEGVH